MGIRSQLLLMLALVLVAGSTALGLLQNRSTTSEFLLLVDEQREQALPPLGEAAEALSEAFVEGGWEGVDAALADLADTDGSHLFMLLAQGQGGRSSHPQFSLRKAQVDAETVRVELDNASAGTRFALAEHLKQTELVYSGDQQLGRLLRFPLPGSELTPPQQRFLQQTRSSLIVLLATLLGAALIIAYVFGRRITRPLQQLAEASERISDGEYGHQVAVRSSDEVGQMASRFNQMSTQLARDQQLRKQMVSDIAHELRTPITGMRCSIEALRDGLLPFEPQTADELHQDLLQLQRLVEDLQMLSLAEAGELNLQWSPTELPELVGAAVRALPASDAEQRVRIAAAELRPITTDAGRLRQVLINLLHNAITHSPPESTVEVQIDQGDQFTCIRVIDSGPGVPESELESIFERFYRTDGARQRLGGSGGSGLGLAISRELVRLLGGQISASNRAPCGLMVTVSLPVESPGHRAQGPVRRSSAG